MTTKSSGYRDQFRAEPGKKIDLSKIHTDDKGGFGDKAAVAKRVDQCREQMRDLQIRLFAERERAVLVCLQGMDSAGKDSVINHVFSAINLMGCEVTSFKPPSELERAHDFLWRHHRATPARGMVGLHNRSHYEAVVIERVEKIVDTATCKRRFDAINNFERMLSEEGTTVVKFFLHISKDEQADRFKARRDDPMKRWKMTPADTAQREKWDENMAAYADAIAHTSTATAPWYIVPSNHKWFRDLVISEIMRETLESLKILLPSRPGNAK